MLSPPFLRQMQNNSLAVNFCVNKLTPLPSGSTVKQTMYFSGQLEKTLVHFSGNIPADVDILVDTLPLLAVN